MIKFRPLNPISLREQVYNVLREELDRGQLKPGQTISLERVSADLGISRSPLRDALLRLEVEGFVTIRPRSGVVVRTLTEADIRNLYQLIGALEASVLLNEKKMLTPGLIQEMELANSKMRQALDQDDFDAYYEANLLLHDAYIGMSQNQELLHRLRVMKQRLYDFPRKREFLKKWEMASTAEHESIVAALKLGDVREAARLVQEVHWSFEVQKDFIRQYYKDELEAS